MARRQQNNYYLISVFMVMAMLLPMLSCQRTGNSVPRPTAYPRLERAYDTVYRCATDMYNIEVNSSAKINYAGETVNSCGLQVRYEKYGATLYCDYWKLDNAADFSQTLASRMERIRRDCGDINPETYYRSYVGYSAHVFYTLRDCLTPVHFIATDSVDAIVYGALVLDKIENYDSIYPVLDYLSYDVNHMIEHLQL